MIDDKIIGFIGAGNMGSAMIGGILKASLVATGQLIASAHSPETLERLHARFKIETTLSNQTVAERSDILVLAVKPDKFDEVLPQIAPHVKNQCIVVSVAAGRTIAAIEKGFARELKLVRAMPNTPALVGEAMSALCANTRVTEEELAEVRQIFEAFGFARELKLVRAMPNTPALVGEAMSALCANTRVTEEELAEVRQIFEAFGKAEVVPESLLDAVVGVSGSSPAYVYLFLEAMADAAVAEGMPREKAYKFAAQAVCGAAKMVLETGRHPGELKDEVCSPGGTTIEAVAADGA